MTEPRCDHQHWSRIGAACAPCFLAHWSEKLPVGTFVTYDDEPEPLCADAAGVIVEPSPDELAHVKTYPDTHGPEAGEVLVEWDGDRELGSWEDPRDLRVISEREYRAAMLDEMVRESAALGLYESTAEPRATR
jgi:hypothetical protein